MSIIGTLPDAPPTHPYFSPATDANAPRPGEVRMAQTGHASPQRPRTSFSLENVCVRSEMGGEVREGGGQGGTLEVPRFVPPPRPPFHIPTQGAAMSGVASTPATGSGSTLQARWEQRPPTKALRVFLRGHTTIPRRLHPGFDTVSGRGAGLLLGTAREVLRCASRPSRCSLGPRGGLRSRRGPPWWSMTLRCATSW